MWNYSIQTTYRTSIIAHRIIVVIKYKTEKKTCLLLDVSILSNRNNAAKIFERLSKYKALDIDLSNSFHLKTKTIPIVIGALGFVPKTTIRYVNEIAGTFTIKEIQKITLFGTYNILRKSL